MRIGVCAYCGRVRQLTKDHVPPKNLFPPPFPSNLITVPSCDECNRGYRLDDEYFRLVIADADDPNLSDENFDHLLRAKHKLFSPTKMRSAVELLLSRMDPSGRRMTVNGDRVVRVVERIVRGLFFRRYGIRLPDSYSVVVTSSWFLGDAEAQAKFESLYRAFGLQPETRLGDDIFEFRCLAIDSDPYVSAWFLQFYGHRRFICVTAPKESANA